MFGKCLGAVTDHMFPFMVNKQTSRISRIVHLFGSMPMDRMDGGLLGCRTITFTVILRLSKIVPV